MKKMVLSLLSLVFAATITAQEMNSEAGHSQWLTDFSEISVSGPVNVVFEQINPSEAPRIVFDTKGSYTSKFKAEVKDKVLTISEKFENNRTTVTDVKVCYHLLDKIRISGATVTFTAPLKASMLDVVVGGGAVVTLPCEIADMKADVSGKSRVILSGDVRYLSLTVSTAKVDAMQLKVMSAMVDASNKAELSLDVTERLEAKALTGGRITYAGDPAIVRSSVAFTGGNIVKAQ